MRVFYLATHGVEGVGLDAPDSDVRRYQAYKLWVEVGEDLLPARLVYLGAAPYLDATGPATLRQVINHVGHAARGPGVAHLLAGCHIVPADVERVGLCVVSEAARHHVWLAHCVGGSQSPQGMAGQELGFGLCAYAPSSPHPSTKT